MTCDVKPLASLFSVRRMKIIKEHRTQETHSFRSGWHAYDCCHATFDNVAMEIITDAVCETESRSVTMAVAVLQHTLGESCVPLCSPAESVVMSELEALIHFHNMRCCVQVSISFIFITFWVNLVEGKDLKSTYSNITNTVAGTCSVLLYCNGLCLVV